MNWTLCGMRCRAAWPVPAALPMTTPVPVRGVRRCRAEQRSAKAERIGQGGGRMPIDERNPRAVRVRVQAQENRIGTLPGWRQRLRTHVVSRGIQMMCGSTADVSADAAADIPLVRGALRLSWLLKALNAVGVTRFIATSKIGYDFVCHTGDLANFPFYHPRAYQAELELCAAWLQGQDRPVIYDVGANGGFFSTHLAQMLAGRAPRIYAFEPVPDTFAKLRGIYSAPRSRRFGLPNSSRCGR